MSSLVPVGKVIFVNGYEGLGSGEAGKSYWTAPFVEEALNVFSVNGNRPYAKFTEEKFHPWHQNMNTDSRRNRGFNFAQSNYNWLVPSAEVDVHQHALAMVTHSMGAAFGEGILQCLKQHGWTVRATVHINPFQPTNILRSNPRTLTVHYQNPDDPVTRNVTVMPPSTPFPHAFGDSSLNDARNLAIIEHSIKAAGNMDSGVHYKEHRINVSPLAQHASAISWPSTWLQITPFLPR